MCVCFACFACFAFIELANAVYKAQLHPYTDKTVPSNAGPLNSRSRLHTFSTPHPPEQTAFTTSLPGETCSFACSAISVPGHGQWVCNPQLFPLVHNHCGLLKDLTGCVKCSKQDNYLVRRCAPGFVDSETVQVSAGHNRSARTVLVGPKAFNAPAQPLDGRQCGLGRGKDLGCNFSLKDFSRVCVCTESLE